ncbi:MAG TPA: hypothetical protein VGS19_08260 [Streptosporangiaceae bacterium]|nr:hypothetical protein [Streptosporangiaceae bacterium]
MLRLVVDWASLANVATAAGTLVLAVATFSATRSANRAARAAERSLLVGLRPMVVASRLTDEAQKVTFADTKVVKLPGGCAWAEVVDETVYLAASLRNVGPGIGILQGWIFYPDWDPGRDRPELKDFRRLNRDLYLAPGEMSFWQGTFRDPADPQHGPATRAIQDPTRLTVDLLYGDHEGGQRVITRFGFQPWQGQDRSGWLLVVSRHWNVDRPDPRQRDDWNAEHLHSHNEHGRNHNHNGRNHNHNGHGRNHGT